MKKDMRYLKTYWGDAQSKLARYESFYQEEDMLMEIASFLDGCSVTEEKINDKYGDTSMFRIYVIQPQNEHTEQGEKDFTAGFDAGLEALTQYMNGEKDLGVFLQPQRFIWKTKKHEIAQRRITIYEGKFPGSDHFSIIEAGKLWLERNFGGLEMVDSVEDPGTVLFRFEEGDNLMIFGTDRILDMDHDRMLAFFGVHTLKQSDINDIAKEWVESKFGIDIKDVDVLDWRSHSKGLK